MQAQLNRIEVKVDKLIVSVEHRLTEVEATQRGIKWLIGIAVTAVTIVLTVL